MSQMFLQDISGTEKDSKLYFGVSEEIFIFILFDCMRNIWDNAETEKHIKLPELWKSNL